MPRPVNQEALDKVERLVAEGMGLGAACAQAGTSPLTFKRERKFKPINAQSRGQFMKKVPAKRVAVKLKKKSKEPSLQEFTAAPPSGKLFALYGEPDQILGFFRSLA